MHKYRKKRKMDEFDPSLLLQEISNHDTLSKLSTNQVAEELEDQIGFQMYDSIVYDIAMVVDCKLNGYSGNWRDNLVEFTINGIPSVTIELLDWKWCIHVKDNIKGEQYKYLDLNGEYLEDYTSKKPTLALEYTKTILVNLDNIKQFELSEIYKLYLALDNYDLFLSIFTKFRPRHRIKHFIDFLSISYTSTQLIHIGYKTAKLIIELNNNSAITYINKVFWCLLNQCGDLESFNPFNHITAIKSIVLQDITKDNALRNGYLLLNIALMLLHLASHCQFTIDIQNKVNEWHSQTTLLMIRFRKHDKYLRLSHLTLNHLLDLIIQKNALSDVE